MPEHHNTQNVLDLRRVMAERQAAAEQPKRRRRQSSLHRPPKAPRDWRGLSRESIKFAAAVAVVGGCLWLGQWLWRTWSTVQTATAQARQGAHALETGIRNLSIDQPDAAGAAFHQADQAFAASVDGLHKVNRSSGTLIQRLPWIGARWTTGMQLATAGQELAAAGESISQILPTGLADQPIVSVTTKGIVQGSIGWLRPLLQHRTTFLAAIDQILNAVDRVANIDSRTLPTSLREQVAPWEALKPIVSGPNGRLRPLVKTLLGLVASPKPKDELVIFENNDELRAAGGFAGTFLLVEFNQGTFQILDSPGNGPYALASQLPDTILPPQPLLAINSTWGFQDTNWFVDVPTSAGFALHFYEQARGFRPDGVIYITPQLMEDLLHITGPVRPENYKIDITADNFVKATELQVEFGYDKALNNPKQFLIDLVPTMVQKIASLPGVDAARAGLAVMNAADHQNLMVVSEDDEVQRNIQALGWDGKLLAPDDDGLVVVDSNIGGGKTDRSITENIDAHIVDTGTVLRHTVTVTRKHNGTPNDPLSGPPNTDFIRIYAPKDAQLTSVTGETIPADDFFKTPNEGAKAPAQLLSAEGTALLDPQTYVRVTHESGRSVFGAWSVVAPGGQQTVIFTYTTPRSSQKSWSLLWQHQPGAPLRTWTVTYEAASGRKITSTTGGKVRGRKVTWETTSTSNQVFGILFR